MGSQQALDRLRADLLPNEVHVRRTASPAGPADRDSLSSQACFSRKKRIRRAETPCGPAGTVVGLSQSAAAVGWKAAPPQPQSSGRMAGQPLRAEAASTIPDCFEAPPIVPWRSPM